VTPPAAAAVAPNVHRGRTAVPPRPSVAPRRPRRVSGPARQPARPLERSVESERGLALGLLAGLNSLSRSPSLDRLIRGRTWIALIAFALIGIVTLQLLVLKLNANIGRALVREGQLQRENAALSIESSELAAGERVEAQAAHLGMQLVPEGALRFLSNDPHADIARAASALRAPVHTSSTSTSTSAAAATEASTTPPAQTSTEAAEASTATSAQTSSESTEASAESAGESAATPASASETAPAGEQSATASATGAAEATSSSGAG
jgi:cell division protein FtsL